MGCMCLCQLKAINGPVAVAKELGVCCRLLVPWIYSHICGMNR